MLCVDKEWEKQEQARSCEREFMKAHDCLQYGLSIRMAVLRHGKSAYAKTVMRGGRKIGRRNADNGDGNSGRAAGVTVSCSAKAENGGGSAWNPQHQQMPLQVSGGTVC